MDYRLIKLRSDTFNGFLIFLRDYGTIEKEIYWLKLNLKALRVHENVEHKFSKVEKYSF